MSSSVERMVVVGGIFFLILTFIKNVAVDFGKIRPAMLQHCNFRCDLRPRYPA